MKKCYLFIAVMLLAVSIVSAATPKKWTLKECIDYALTNNITLQKNRLSTQSAKEDVLQSKSALLPSLDASTSHSVLYRPWTNESQNTVSNGTVQSSVRKTYYNGSYGINASWTVWNGNANRNNIKLYKLTEQKAELDSAVTANSIQEKIAQVYVQILYINEAINVDKESYDVSKKDESRGEEMVKVGKMSKADLAQLTAQTAQDKYNIVEAESNMANYKLQLKQLLEITNEQEFDVEIPGTSDEQAKSAIPELQAVYQAALTSRPEIKNTQLAIQSSELSINIAKAGLLPTISLTGGLGTSTTTLGSNSWGNQMKTNFDASIGASVSIPLFDNRKTKTAVNKAKIERANQILNLQDTQKTLYSTIETYWLDANTNQQKFVAAKSSVESQQASYDLLSEQFRLGLKNIIELMTGKTNLLSAQQSELQSKYMAILYMQLLKFYKGEDITM